MRYYPLSIVCGVAIFVLSTMNAEQLPPMLFSFKDKALHAIAYGGLSGTLLLELIWNNRCNRRNYWLFGALLPILAGVAMEFVQHYLFPPRQGDLFDVFADMVGVALSLCLFALLKPSLSKLFKKLKGA